MDVNIGSQTPSNIFQVGDGGKLRISNGISDYSLIGTKDTDYVSYSRIVITGNTRPGYAGNIEYIVTTGNHIFYTSDSEKKIRISNSGNVGIGTSDSTCHLQVNGLACIDNGSPLGYAFMQSGSLTIGGTNADYGGNYYPSGGWSGTNTTGLLL
jgi:hypothetical protein